MELLLYFRSNKYIILPDLKQAFLNIRLADINYCNCFFFFLKLDEKLVDFPYRTILFGLNSSPIILNYIIKFHANKFLNYFCTEFLKSKFYIDNFIKTRNSPKELPHIYIKSNKRSLVTNNEKLKHLFKDQGKIC